MDELLLFNDVLAAEEMLQLFEYGSTGTRFIASMADSTSYWTLDDADLSGTTVLDVVGTNDGTNSGATTGQTGAVGESFEFASPDVVTVTNDASLQFTTGMSISGWTNFTLPFPAGFSAGFVLSKDAASPNRGYALRQTWQADGSYQYLFDITRDGTTTDRATFSLDPGSTKYLNNWTHLLGTYDGTDIKLYVDGVEEATTNAPGTMVTNTQDVEIGARSSFSASYWDGQLDEVAVWSEGIRPVDAKILYNYGVPNIPSPLLALSFDNAETSGSTLTDKSYRGHDGTLVGSPTTGSTGQVNQSYTFNGTTQYVNFGNISDLDFTTTDAFSISVWFNVSAGAGQATILSKYSFPAGGPGWQLFLRPSGSLGFSFSNANFSLARFAETTSTAFRDSAWRHAVFTYDGSNNTSGMTMYMNGVSGCTCGRQP
jgi:hypothetical protein